MNYVVADIAGTGHYFSTLSSWQVIVIHFKIVSPYISYVYPIFECVTQDCICDRVPC